MTLKCSFEIVRLITTINHLLRLLFEDVVLAIGASRTHWLWHVFFSVPGLINTAEKSSDMVLLVAVVEE